MGAKHEVEYGDFVYSDGTIERSTKVYFDTDKEWRDFIEGLNGEYPEGFCGGTSTNFTKCWVVIESKRVPVSEMFAYQRSQEQEEE